MIEKLQVSEIYESVQGESTWAGWPCIFIRLTGCPLRCRWCDTAYGFTGGDSLSVSQIMERISGYKARLVELTGGEPMAQKLIIPLMEALNQRDYTVMIETGGALSIKEVPSYVNIVMDLKCPDSGMSQRNDYANLDLLKATDNIKFVIASHRDFLWALEITEKFGLSQRCQVLMSPAWGLIKPDQLVSWMLESGVSARLNLQTHKYIWHPKAKGV